MPVTLIDTFSRFHPDQHAYLNGVATFLLKQNNIADHSVSIVLTNDTEISQLNKRYRNHDGPTNVLSFPFHADFDLPDSMSSLNLELGDIIISVETAEREAQRYNHSLCSRLAWLMTHGILHLLGYDHERSEDDAEKMYDLEKKLLDELQSKKNEI